MSLFQHTQVIPVVVADLTPVASAVARQFEDRGFTTHITPVSTHCQEVGITRGWLFKAVLGLKTALCLKIETVGGATRIGAGIGLLESQGVSSAVSMLAFWPVLVTQTWGIVKQSKLDEEAIAVAEEALLALSKARGAVHFCHACGASVTGTAAFCPACGVKVSL